MLSHSLSLHLSVYCMLVLLVLTWYFWSELFSMFFSFSMFLLFSINVSFYMLFSSQKPIILTLNWSHLLLLKSKMFFFYLLANEDMNEDQQREFLWRRCFLVSIIFLEFILRLWFWKQSFINKVMCVEQLFFDMFIRRKLNFVAWFMFPL